MYKAIVFDMDGTLADTDLVIVATYIKMFKKFRPDFVPSLKEMVYFSGPPLDLTLKTYFPNYEYDFILKEYKRLSKPNYKKYILPFPNEKEALEKLKSYGYHLVVLTNKVHSATMLSLALMNIPTALFDMIIGSDDMPFPKPDPSGMRIVMEKLHLQSNEVLYVGDNGVDFQFAENVGIDSMLVTWTLREIPQYAKPKYFVSSFDEIVEVLTNG